MRPGSDLDGALGQGTRRKIVVQDPAQCIDEFDDVVSRQGDQVEMYVEDGGQQIRFRRRTTVQCTDTCFACGRAGGRAGSEDHLGAPPFDGRDHRAGMHDESAGWCRVLTGEYDAATGPDPHPQVDGPRLGVEHTVRSAFGDDRRSGTRSAFQKSADTGSVFTGSVPMRAPTGEQQRQATSSVPVGRGTCGGRERGNGSGGRSSRYSDPETGDEISVLLQSEWSVVIVSRDPTVPVTVPGQ